MKKISVIVPVYNVEDYLVKCLNSIRTQSFHHLEILITDDGAIDRSGELCDEQLLQDDRMIVIHKTNGGLSDARNYGLDLAAGDYIGFVDSDDYIESDLYELLAANMEKYRADVSCCRYANVYEDGTKESIGDSHKTNVYDGLDGLKEYLYGKVFDPFVWNKLYQAYSMRNTLDRTYSIRFIKGILGEDNPFNTEILKHTNRIVVAGEAKYNYLQQRPGAITNTNVSKKTVDSILWWDDFRKNCEMFYPELTKYAFRRELIFYVGLFKEIIYDAKFNIEKKQIREFLKNNLFYILKDNIIEWKYKFATILLIFTPCIYYRLIKIYNKIKL